MSGWVDVSRVRLFVTPWSVYGILQARILEWFAIPLSAKFRLKLKKVGKTTRPLRYDLNQIPYDYTVEAKNRLKGLDRIDRVLQIA